MAKAVFEAPPSPNEQPNQQQTYQIYQNFPKPRVERVAAQNTLQSNGISDALFSTKVDPEYTAQATAYIAEQLKDRQALKAGAFLIGLLEKVQAIPTEVVAEEEVERKERVETVEQLLLDLQQFIDEAGKFNGSAFAQAITEKIGEDQIDEYPIVHMLRRAILQLRRSASKNSVAEVQLVTAQRLALIGIAKQLGVYN